MARVVVEGARVWVLGEPDLDKGAHEALLKLLLGEDLGRDRAQHVEPVDEQGLGWLEDGHDARERRLEQLLQPLQLPVLKVGEERGAAEAAHVRLERPVDDEVHDLQQVRHVHGKGLDSNVPAAYTMGWGRRAVK